jgi:hypothetical protein
MEVEMKALLIKPEEQSIEEVEFAGTLQDAYRLMDVRIIERVEIPDHDVWVDEEGLFSGSSKYGTFSVAGGLYGDTPHLFGRGLITGKAENQDGEETWGDVTLSVEDAKSFISFP